MTTRHLISIVLGTIVLFVWNAISWMALPFHNKALTNIPETALQLETMKTQMPESGVYHYPGVPANFSEEAMAEVEQQLANGP
ncbi:MAG: hypothetical protein AAF598_17075, partial [Bacteroidota bacterium]